jgi:lipase chaperone LimK
VKAARAAIVAAALLALALGLALLRDGERRGTAPAPAENPAPDALAAPPAARPAPSPLPDSLAGTSVGGDLRQDARGRFVPGPEALALFDYFLAATGEEPAERIRARIVAEIVRRLPAEAAREAEALLDRYLAYREAARERFSEHASIADPERRFQLVRELRRELFGAGLAAALFGEEERVLAVDIERQRVAQREDLDPGERERLLAALEEQLPEAERSARRDARAAADLRAAEAALRAAGAGPAEIQAERERRFGPEAAERLALLDRRRADWDERVAAYREARAALRAEGREAEDYEAALAALRAARFEGPERLRIEALDRVEAAAPPP